LPRRAGGEADYGALAAVPGFPTGRLLDFSDIGHNIAAQAAFWGGRPVPPVA